MVHLSYYFEFAVRHRLRRLQIESLPTTQIGQQSCRPSIFSVARSCPLLTAAAAAPRACPRNAGAARAPPGADARLRAAADRRAADAAAGPDGDHPDQPPLRGAHASLRGDGALRANANANCHAHGRGMALPRPLDGHLAHLSAARALSLSRALSLFLSLVANCYSLSSRAVGCPMAPTLAGRGGAGARARGDAVHGGAVRAARVLHAPQLLAGKFRQTRGENPLPWGENPLPANPLSWGGENLLTFTWLRIRSGCEPPARVGLARIRTRGSAPPRRVRL